MSLKASFTPTISKRSPHITKLAPAKSESQSVGERGRGDRRIPSNTQAPSTQTGCKGRKDERLPLIDFGTELVPRPGQLQRLRRVDAEAERWRVQGHHDTQPPNSPGRSELGAACWPTIAGSSGLKQNTTINNHSSTLRKMRNKGN